MMKKSLWKCHPCRKILMESKLWQSQCSKQPNINKVKCGRVKLQVIPDSLSSIFLLQTKRQWNREDFSIVNHLSFLTWSLYLCNVSYIYSSQKIPCKLSVTNQVLYKIEHSPHAKSVPVHFHLSSQPLAAVLALQMRTERLKTVSKDPMSHSHEVNQNGNPEKKIMKLPTRTLESVKLLSFIHCPKYQAEAEPYNLQTNCKFQLFLSVLKQNNIRIGSSAKVDKQKTYLRRRYIFKTILKVPAVF